MKSLFSFVTPAHDCSYLPDRTAQLKYEIVLSISSTEYQNRLRQGWRHFGRSLFRPQCGSCQSCQSLRIPVKRFRPNRSQRRAWQMNGDVTVTIGEPAVTEEKLDLYDRFHAFQTMNKGWPEHHQKENSGYVESFVDNPVPTREWQFSLDGRLIGVGYVDHLPDALSAIYFFYDPDHRRRSLGTFNVLYQLAEARRQDISHLYLGYYVAGCASLEYKANFRPNQVIDPSGDWVDFQT